MDSLEYHGKIACDAFALWEKETDPVKRKELSDIWVPHEKLYWAIYKRKRLPGHVDFMYDGLLWNIYGDKNEL